MSFSTISTYNNITSLLESEECILADLLKEPNIQNALRKRIPYLADFITTQAGQLVDLALGVEQIDGINAQPICFSMIVTQVKNFTPYLIESSQFAQHLNDYLANNIEIDENSATIFARIFKFCIIQTCGSILNRWPDRENFLQKLVNHMDHIAIHSLIMDLTNDTGKSTIAFLEDNHASEVFLSNVSNNVKKSKNLYAYLTSMITLAEIDSPLLSPFEDEAKMTEIYDLAMNTESAQLSGQIFTFLTRLTDQIDVDDGESEEENEDPLIDSVIKLGFRKLEEIIAFLKKDTPFLNNKDQAIKLILSLLLHDCTVPQCLFSYGSYLFSQIFENPTHSIMHNAFLSIFDVLLIDLDKFLVETNMKVRIEEAFQFRYRIDAAYWGVLYECSIKIRDNSLNKNDDEDWEIFLEMIINKMHDTMEKEYGGSIPTEEEEDISDDDIFPIGNCQKKQEKA